MFNYSRKVFEIMQIFSLGTTMFYMTRKTIIHLSTITLKQSNKQEASKFLMQSLDLKRRNINYHKIKD